MRFVLAFVMVGLLATPIAAQHRGRGPNNGAHPRTARPYRPARHHGYYPRSTYGYPAYGTYGAYGHHGYPYHGIYPHAGYGYYPGAVGDFGLATFLLRQRQDFGSVPVPAGWYQPGWYDVGAYGEPLGWGDDSYDATPRRRGRDAGRGPDYGDYGRERDNPPLRSMPRGSNRTRELVVDGVPTLTSDN
jgi:hypothetical protein